MARFRKYLLRAVFIFCRCSCAGCADFDHCNSAACNTRVEQ